MENSNSIQDRTGESIHAAPMDADYNFQPVAHDHACCCGGMVRIPHRAGEPGCFRHMTASPMPLENDRWLVDGHEITGFTLREQRGYFQHPCGCWSRHEGSENSIPDET